MKNIGVVVRVVQMFSAQIQWRKIKLFFSEFQSFLFFFFSPLVWTASCPAAAPLNRCAHESFQWWRNTSSAVVGGYQSAKAKRDEKFTIPKVFITQCWCSWGCKWTSSRNLNTKLSCSVPWLVLHLIVLHRFAWHCYLLRASAWSVSTLIAKLEVHAIAISSDCLIFLSAP